MNGQSTPVEEYGILGIYHSKVCGSSLVPYMVMQKNISQGSAQRSRWRARGLRKLAHMCAGCDGMFPLSFCLVVTVGVGKEQVTNGLLDYLS